MEEVPPSPEIVKRRKNRRKNGSSFKRLSFQQSTINNVSTHSVETPPVDATNVLKSHENSSRKKLSTFYYDDSSAEIETVNANPLASAILLERGNAISTQCIVTHSQEFVAATGEEFLSAAELAKREARLNQPKRYGQWNDRPKQNYSFTQLEVDSQMIDIFEAAELLACSAKEDQPKANSDAGLQIPEVPAIENIPEISAQSKPAVECVLAPAGERTIGQAIADDFSEDEGFAWEVDFSVVKTESLRRRLRQLQDYIASPPKAVKRETVCRRYGSVKRPAKESISRRLSYETDCSSRVEHPLSDDDDDDNDGTVRTPGSEVVDSDGADISMDVGVALNESILIQANLTQLSAFFSQAISRTDSEARREEDKDETSSVDREPSFHGFSPEPASPISLPSKEERSPRVLRFEFRPFGIFDGDSLQSVADEHLLPLAPKCPQIEQLLEDDEDLFMLAHPLVENVAASRDQRSNGCTDRRTDPRDVPVTVKSVSREGDISTGMGEMLHPQPSVGFNTGRGSSIKISDAAFARAAAMFAEEEGKMLQECNDRRAENNRPAEELIEPTEKMQSCNASKLSSSGLTLGPCASSNTGRDNASYRKKRQPEPAQDPFGPSAGTTPISKSDEPAATIRSMFDVEKEAVKHARHDVNRLLERTEVETKPKVENTVQSSANLTSAVEAFGASATSSTMTVPKTSLSKPQSFFDADDLKMDKENVSGNMPLGSFCTAGGSKIAISKKALERAQKMFDETEVDDAAPPDQRRARVPVPSNLPAMGGFSTAAGSTIAISEEALSRAQHMFAEEDRKDDVCESIPSMGGGFSTAGGSKIAISKKALERAQKMFDETDVDDTAPLDQRRAQVPIPSARFPAMGGFSTAAGSTIAITEEALPRARTIFAEEDRKDDVCGTMASMGGGFSTAGGSKIAISKKALERAQKMFAEDEDGESHDRGGSTVLGEHSLPTGSRTAPGSAIDVSKAALDRVKSTFTPEGEYRAAEETTPCGSQPQADADNGLPLKNVPPMGGFCTAAGKGLQVSEEALAKAQLLFEQVEQDFARESDAVPSVHTDVSRKRKASSSQEEPTTPTKRPRMNHPASMANFQTSTPASAVVPRVDAIKSYTGPNASTKPATVGHEVEQFFAELDDEEFEELFRHQQAPADPSEAKKSNKLLARFDQCADVVVKTVEDTTVNTSTSHWDDSFTELLPKLAPDEQKTAASWPAEEVQRARSEELEKQRHFIESKPEEMRRPRVSSYCRNKTLAGRVGLAEFVGENCRPVPGVAMNASTSVTLNNALGFRFSMIDHYGKHLCSSNTTGVQIGSDREATLLMDQHSCVGVEEMRQCLLASPGVDPRLVPTGWVENAWRWIVAKLSALERNVAAHCRGALTPENVFLQLQYRYHVEIDCARRPALRKVLEKDDIAGRRMVLFVSNVFPVDRSIVGLELELSDGWYAVRTVIDAPLAEAVHSGKIAIGTKLMLQGGELLNHRDGCSPLEVPPEVRLKIHANSTRRVRWPVKLGYYRWPVPFLVTCRGIHERGGLIGRFRAFIVRVYPLVFVEKPANESSGGSILRSERMQQRHSRRHDASQLDSLHKLYNRVQQEIESERTTAAPNRSIRVTESTPCSQLQELLEAGLDVSCLDIELTLSQQAIIQRFQQQRQEELQNEINRRVKAQMDKRVASRSSVTSLLKVRLMDRTTNPERAFVLSIWRPTDDVRAVMQEHNFLELHNISANGRRNNDVQLTANKSSTYRKLPTGLSDGELARFTRSITPIADIDALSFRPPFNEFDTVGVVVHVGAADSKKFQSIYLADTAMDLLCVNFWHGLGEFAYEDVIRERALLCVANLQWRTIGRQQQPIAQAFATEYTTFTEKPRAGPALTECDRFQLQLDAIDGEKFFERCQEKVAELNGSSTVPGTPPVTPYQQRQLSGSLLQPQSATPHRGTGGGEGGSAAKRKMETLATIYGSPPKLSPIVIRTNPILRKGFKTPARLDGSSRLAASTSTETNDSVV